MSATNSSTNGPSDQRSRTSDPAGDMPTSRTVEASGRYAEMSFEARMDTVESRVHERAHIVVDGRKCVDCSVRGCITACPANLFVPTADGGILFNYEQCFECGTCYMVCNEEGAISWSYPEGGHGVVFHAS